MLKFGRNFKTVFTIGHWDKTTGQKQDDETITLEYPFSVNFTIDTGTYSSANNAQFQFFNLSPDTQSRLWLDIFNIGTKYVKIDFYAGYQNELPLLFSGYFTECTSMRAEGSTDWITTIQTIIGGDFLQNSFINATYSKGTTTDNLLRYAIVDSDLKLGYITKTIPSLKMNRTFIGRTMELISQEFAGYSVFLDNNELNIIAQNEVIPSAVDTIDDSIGLLGSPKRANIFLELDTLFAPQYKLGQKVELNSKSMERFKDINGSYKIVSLKHQGMISPSVAGRLTTKIILSKFTVNEDEIKTLEKSKETVYQAPAKNIKWQKPVQYNRVSSGYGWRIHPIEKTKKFHKGIDLAAPKNTPVYAASDGKIVFAGWNNGYGKYIRIEHGKVNNVILTSGYGHLNEIIATNGKTVAKGELIGRVGSTGESTGNHLHFEIREGNNAVNPNKYVRF